MVLKFKRRNKEDKKKKEQGCAVRGIELSDGKIENLLLRQLSVCARSSFH